MSDQEITPQEKLLNLLDKYYVHNPSVDEEKELELRYGIGENNITKNQFNNVMNKLKTMGFLLLNTEGDYMLRIINDKERVVILTNHLFVLKLMN